MKKILFAVLVLVTSTAFSQNAHFQWDYEDGVQVQFMMIGVDPKNPPAENVYALLTNQNDFPVHATLSLKTDVAAFALSYEVVIPAGADMEPYPIGLIYKNEDWSALEASKSGTWIELDIHEPGLRHKLWCWIYLPKRFYKWKNFAPGMEIGNGHYFNVWTPK